MPGRHLNDTERHLLDLWNSNYGPSLRSVEITDGVPLRGMHGIVLDLRYPLVVIAGKNGTGKSTLLACIACAYRNSSAYVTHFLHTRCFNFNDLFANTPLDTDITNVKVRWTYRTADRSIKMAEATKGPSRWRGYQKRPDRATDFIGLIRALHPSELRVLRGYFGRNAVLAPASLSATHKSTVSSIMTRNYEDVQCEVKGRYSLHFLQVEGTRYSGFNAGSGEDISCLISRVLQNLPDRSLLVIEEMETGLHPAAQRRLVEQLLNVCWNRKIQIVCSSHSQTILESVPTQARVLLTRCGPTIQPRYGVSVAEAVSEMAELPADEICVYVEDDVAKCIVLESLPAETRKRIRIVTCGGWDDVIRFLSVFRRDPNLGNAVGIVDGERDGRDQEHRESLNRYMGGGVTEGDWTWLSERFRCLPGGVPPEALFREFGRDPAYCDLVAKELNAQPQMITDFFATFVNNDDHALPYELGQRVGHDEERALVALARASCMHRTTDFQQIGSFIAERIEEGAH
ncbi:MAG TPA: ATP-binding protein [Dissulfurispiraceae bacterium]|nr:ATP-binding protein [Dissulfurispiraceae bacterium]